MASHLKNLSEYRLEEVPDLTAAKIGVIVSEWNDDNYFGSVQWLFARRCSTLD
jgi:hypothetical protein